MSQKLTNPNIILITLDGARYDRIKNFPNFKNLTEKGTLFSQMITYAPYTIAAMHAIFSGAYGNRNGVNNYYASPYFKEDSFMTLTTYLKDKGYSTIGDILNEICVPKQGFDELTIQNTDNLDLTERHSKLLKKASKLKKKGQNFFLFLHYSKIQNSIKINVSRKYNNFSKEYFEKKDDNLKAYDGYAKEADDYLGEILNKINELDLSDSLVLVNTDHGMGVGEKFGEKAYGVYCYDYTAKAFAVFYHPDIFPAKEVKELVRTVDILPTILDVLDIKQDKTKEKIDGKTMMPMIEGKKDDRYAFIESGNPYPDHKIPPRKPNVRAIRTKKWKFILNNWNNDSEELYDLESDPEETNNLINKEKKIAEDLRNKLNLELRRGLKAKVETIKKNLN